MKVDVIIPTCYPQKRFLELVDMLCQQTVPVNRIIVMNTEEAGFEELVTGMRYPKLHHKMEVHHLSRREFDHGATRNAGVKKSSAEVFVCMTQDALPADERLIEHLLEALAQPGVAVAYARQLPEADCNPIERYTRQFNYGKNSQVKGLNDLKRLGIKTFFCSNTCAAYRRDVFDELGGFVGQAIFNEDMIYASRAVRSGYLIAYAAEARVIHSHNYTARQQFQRNFDLGVSHAQHPEVFGDVPAEGEGLRLVKKTAQWLLHHHPLLLGRLFVHSGAKYLGYRLGRNYRKLPLWLVLKCTMMKSYWKKG